MRSINFIDVIFYLNESQIVPIKKRYPAYTSYLLSIIIVSLLYHWILNFLYVHILIFVFTRNHKGNSGSITQQNYAQLYKVIKAFVIHVSLITYTWKNKRGKTAVPKTWSKNTKTDTSEDLLHPKARPAS